MCIGVLYHSKVHFFLKKHSINVTYECLGIFDVSALELNSKRSTKIFLENDKEATITLTDQLSLFHFVDILSLMPKMKK